ncbi:hypothetical protein IFT64_02230 [Oxalobacteraceae sp. CFBP 8753]|nr:hypothetical protein [Oxalobacteraceae sp. CFBP 8753]
MAFNFNFIPTTIQALTQFVRALDQNRFGAIMLVVVMVLTGVLMAMAYLPATLQQVQRPQAAQQQSHVSTPR